MQSMVAMARPAPLTMLPTLPPPQVDIVQAVAAGLHLGRILFIQIAVFQDIGVAVKGVVVEIHLAVQSDDIVLGGDDQRIDLHQGAVVVDGQVVQVLQQYGKGLHGRCGLC